MSLRIVLMVITLVSIYWWFVVFVFLIDCVCLGCLSCFKFWVCVVVIGFCCYVDLGLIDLSVFDWWGFWLLFGDCWLFLNVIVVLYLCVTSLLFCFCCV